MPALPPSAPRAASPPLSIALLGTPQIAWDGQPLPLARRQLRALLYRLAAAPQPVPRDHLAFLFWPDVPDATARRGLVVLLNHLRRALPEPDAVQATPDAIGLRPDAVRADTTEVAAAIEAGSREHRLDRLAQAVERFRGPFLDGFALPDSEEYGAWIAGERAAWGRRYLAALAALAEGRAARGDYPAAIAAARRALAADPLDEAIHRRLIALHAVADDRAAALRQFEACADLLQRELGVAPDAATRALRDRLRDGETPGPADLLADPATAAAWRDEPGARAAAPPPTPPTPPTALIGRAAEVAAVRALITGPGARLVTLRGPGGVGKTHLALQVAREVRGQFADGVAFVPLGALREPGAVVGAIAAACGVQESGETALGAVLRSYLREKDLLLVLDNFEHLLPAAPLVADLLAAAPRLRALATSRVALNLSGEQNFPVPPLPRPDPARHRAPEALAGEPAVALLLERARAADPGFRLTPANGSDLAAICARLDGLPLAIELAAARLRALSPRTLLERLDHRLALLDHGPRDLPDRHRTLRATIDWSHQLLGEAERALFARLAVFADGWTLDAAEAVCRGMGDAAPPTLAGLEALLDAHLLIRTDGADGETRFGMLETIHEYAAERLAERAEAAVVARRHAAHHLALAERAAVAGPDQGRWLARLDREEANLQAAITWALAHAEHEVALRLTGALRRFWLTRGRLGQGRRLIERALALRPPTALGGRPAADDEHRARAHEAASELAVPQGEFVAGKDHLIAAVAIWRALGRRHDLALALLTLGYIAMLAGDAATARAARAEGEALAEALGSPAVRARVAQGKGRDARNTADADTAHEWLEVSLAFARAQGDPLMLSHRLLDLVPVTLALGEVAAARAQAGEALTLARGLRHRVALALALNDLGEIARHGGDYRRAAARYEESLRLRRAMGNRSDVPRLLHNLAYCALHGGDAARATTLFRQSAELFRERRIGRGVAEALTGLACAAAAQDRPLRAARLWGAAEALREAANWGMWPPDQVEYARYTALARAAVAEAAFAAAWRAGRGLTPEQALADEPPAPPAPSAHAERAVDSL